MVFNFNVGVEFVVGTFSSYFIYTLNTRFKLGGVTFCSPPPSPLGNAGGGRGGGGIVR